MSRVGHLLVPEDDHLPDAVEPLDGDAARVADVVDLLDAEGLLRRYDLESPVFISHAELQVQDAEVLIQCTTA